MSPIRSLRPLLAAGVAVLVLGPAAPTALAAKKPPLRVLVSNDDQGANLGPFINLSGTVGAARAAAQAGIPALATSEGTLTVSDFRPGVVQTIAWLAANRGHLVKRSVQNLNIPECATGTVRGTVKVGSAFAVPTGVNVFAKVDCGQLSPAGSDDVTAFLAGFAPVTKVPVRPVVPAR